MTRLAISVEGPTEEEFVKEVLAGHLQYRGVRIQPVLLNGHVTIGRLASDIAKLFWSFDFVTSLVDFYGFHDKDGASPKELERLIHGEVVARIDRSFDESRIFPYVQRHEFEGLLFSDVNAFRYLGLSDETMSELQYIRAQFPTPEDINDNVDTAPSKRLENLIPRYDKVAFGPLLALETGLDRIRSECPRFNSWLARLESLENTP